MVWEVGAFAGIDECGVSLDVVDLVEGLGDIFVAEDFVILLLGARRVSE